MYATMFKCISMRRERSGCGAATDVEHEAQELVPWSPKGGLDRHLSVRIWARALCFQNFLDK